MPPIYDITTFTQLDYPGKMACIIWLSGCNMRCPYCYNPHIVHGHSNKTKEELLTFLVKRQKLLDGVVLSGGECTLHPQLKTLCAEIKALGYQIKIDTNGSRPEFLKELIEANLVDYIALDYKATAEKYKTVAGIDTYQQFTTTLEMLVQKDFPFEVRTTVHTDLLDENDLNQMIADLAARGYKNTYYLQNYMHVEHTLHHIQNQSRTLEPTQLSDTLEVELRNF